ncbi:MAG: trypsin-like serine protease [Acidimicrobiales bacterium]
MHLRPRSRLAALAAGLLLAGTSVAAAPAGAQDGPTTQVIGGSVAGSEQFPWTAAVLFRGASRLDGLHCGATVLSRSWALTAGHCVVDYDDAYPDRTYGAFLAPSALDVLTGTSSLAGAGGQRLQVVEIVVHPSYRPDRNDWDVALLRLASPTSAPEVAVVGTSAVEAALDDAGTTATATGWGVTRYPSATPSASLRYVQVPIQSASSCTSSYPPGFADSYGPLEYHDATMVCAGLPGGGKDTCSGDSGGPLVVAAGDGSWRQVGVTSFGYRCASAGYPGVYHRLTSTSSWIGRTRRFGPFSPEASAYVRRQYLDFTGRPPSAAQLASWRATLDRVPASDLITALQASATWDGNAGMNVRLYRAAFLRDPDSSGLDFWVRQRWAGRGPVSIANHFAASSEFLRRYGALDDAGYVTQVYRNVFERDPDPGGFAYWVRKLGAGTGRGQVLYELSNSSEYRRDTDERTRIITTRFGLLRTVPTPTEIAGSAELSQRALVDLLRTSTRYAQRVAG